MRVRLVTGLLVLGLGLTGCSDDEPGAGPTLPPVSESPSAEASASVQPVPSEATAATPQGAADFARFFYEEIGRGFQSRDSTTLASISDPGCEVCQRYVNSIDSLVEQNARVEGNEITVRDAVTPALTNPNEAAVTVLYDNTAGRIVGPDGAVLLEEAARSGVVAEVMLSRVDSGWTVKQVQAP